ncbi:hypothetical protein GGI25_001698 [Coemansia spiralis]|uniref:Uncharacterized protein n=2 Tax=Coemansia TaxID=4863 RepID=A0A9W8KZQ7_9FUNG|nr:hypothetical protein EDC05_003450 [Coemansia umbellata]KAJ2624962.1 hypothetical protein GGI26_001074 [Coemansia sp. RSA 1358]KAJ2679130.1 hypothetical protein GGI25_001698 [Coemansia spiralis]
MQACKHLAVVAGILAFIRSTPTVCSENCVDSIDVDGNAVGCALVKIVSKPIADIGIGIYSLSGSVFASVEEEQSELEDLSNSNSEASEAEEGHDSISENPIESSSQSNSTDTVFSTNKDSDSAVLNISTDLEVSNVSEIVSSSIFDSADFLNVSPATSNASLPSDTSNSNDDAGFSSIESSSNSSQESNVSSSTSGSKLDSTTESNSSTSKVSSDSSQSSSDLGSESDDLWTSTVYIDGESSFVYASMFDSSPSSANSLAKKSAYVLASIPSVIFAFTIASLFSMP